MAQSKTHKNPDRKPTIGLVINTIERSARHINGQKVWLGVMDAAKARGVNVLCFHVDFMSKKPPQDTAKTLYQLIDKQNVDGLIFSLYWDQEKFNHYCSRFSSSLPIVNIRRHFEGHSTVIQDDYQGMRDAVAHLVQAHGRKKIAYVRGAEANVPSQDRYRGYVDALAEHNLQFNPKFVTPWDVIRTETGKKNIDLLIDKNSLKPGVDFDAVAVSNDRMGWGVLEALAERGVRVPYDVSVIGFDDLAGSEFTNPPIATMALPYYQMGTQAAEKLFALLDGAEPELLLASPILTARQSCGCVPADVQQAAANTNRSAKPKFKTISKTQQKEMVAAMIESTDHDKVIVEWAEQVLDAFLLDVYQGDSGKFLEKLDEALRSMIATEHDVFMWQTAVSAMRRDLYPIMASEHGLLADNLWQQASVMIGKFAYRVQKQQILQINDQAELLRHISTQFSTLFDLNQLMDSLGNDLPKLGIPSAYLSLYEEPTEPGDNARLVLAYSKNGRHEGHEGQTYPSRQIVPQNLIAQDRQASFVMESLHFRNRPIGFVAFEVGPLDGNIYSFLGKEISSALQGALMVEQMQRRADHLQASVEVTEAISKILDPNDLVHQVVELIRERFDLYFVGLFLLTEGRLLDPSPKKYALLRAGTGEAGQQMVAKGHRLEVDGNSMIGRCVAIGEPCIAEDVGQEPAHFANPLLPETRSELALPLISRGETIGALGLQSTHKSAFDQDDAAILQTMASQLASAIENARLFNQAEEAMDKLQTELRSQVREGWSRYLGNRK